MAPGNVSRDYKPVALRWPVLFPLIIYVAGLIAVVAVVGRTFPPSDDIGEQSVGAESLPTALFSVPLVNARAPLSDLVAPVAPTPSPRRRLPAGSHLHFFARQGNTTENDPSTNTPQESPGTPIESANVTEIQQDYLGTLNKTGEPIQFAARLASPPPVSALNGTKGNQT